MRPFIDPNDPFFRRPATRWAASCIPLIWAAAESWFGNYGWAILLAAIGAYASYILLWKGPSA